MNWIKLIYITFYIFILPMSFADYYTVNGVSNPVMLEAIKTNLSEILDTPQTNNQKLTNELGRKNIENTLKSLGYYNSTVTSFLKNRQHEFYIQSGPPSLIQKIKLNVTKKQRSQFDPSFFKEIIKRYKSKIFSQNTYKALKADIKNTLIHQGFLFSTLSKTKATVDTKEHSVDIHIDCQLNHKIKFGQTVYQGTGLSKNFLDRFAPFKMNEIYDEEKLNLFREYIVTSNLFKSITIIPDINPELQIVPIHIHFTPTDYYHYKYGLGYDSRENMQLKTEFLMPRLNSVGHSLKIEAEGSWTDIKDKGFEFNNLVIYSIPGKHPHTDSYNLKFLRRSNINQKLNNSLENEISLEYKDKISLFNRSFSLNFIHSANLTSKSKESFLTYGKILIHFVKNFPDNFLSTSTYLKLAASSTKVLSDHDLIFILLKNKFKKSFKNYRLIFKAEHGFLNTNQFSRLPHSLKFKTGGAGSIRGYSYQSIGYGDHYQLLSPELQAKIVPNWYLAGFYDQGFASFKFNDNIKKSFGAGIVWDNSMASIGLYIAKPIEQNAKWSLQLAIQSSF